MSSGEVPDASAIVPVSSLRSRFERLENAAPPVRAVSPVAPKPAFLRTAELTNRTQDMKEGDDTDALGTQNPIPNAPPPRRRGETPTRGRPQSMTFANLPQKPPPKVNVDPPGTPIVSSPGNSMSVDLRIPKSKSHSPQSSAVIAPAITPIVSVRSATRSISPSLGALPLTQDHPASKAQSDGFNTGPHSPQLSPSITGAGPPTVNRSKKPDVPKKPALLADKAVALSVPQPTMPELTDHSISPFSTPPSSGPNSPDGSQNQLPREIASSKRHIRGESNASFVEKLTSDSDASPKRRDRGVSDLSLPEVESPIQQEFDSGVPIPSGHVKRQWTHPPQLPTRHGTTGGEDDRPSRSEQPAWLANMRGLNVQSRSLDRKPALPMRPQKTSQSVRTSPVRSEYQHLQRADGLRTQRAATMDVPIPSDISANRSSQQSSLTQGFSRTIVPSQTASNHAFSSINHIAAPAVPAPRRSIDRRREAATPDLATELMIPDEPNVYPSEEALVVSIAAVPPGDYPDPSHASRRPPTYQHRPYHIHTECDARLFAACGRYVCTTGHQTKAWDLSTGERLMHIAHDETVKMTSLIFKPSLKVEDEGKRLWLGANYGDIYEVDIPSQSIVKRKSGAHSRRDVIRMFRYTSQLWTLDDGGELNVWKPDINGIPSLDSQHHTFRCPRGQTFSIAIGSQLWYATGKQIWVLSPGARSESELHVLRSALIQNGTGDIYSGATLSNKPDFVYFGHQDGKVSIYNRYDYTCASVVNVSVYRLSSLTGVGDYLWAGFHTGMVYVYDPSSTPWRVKKEWKAHDKHVCGVFTDRSALWKLDRLQVVTLGVDNMLKIWDGTLEADWLDSRMKELDSEYCSFRELTAAVLTWNAGASKPHYLQHDKEDDTFFRDYMTDKQPPDIFVFGFQELVDLEDKKTTAKAFFKSRKKDPGEAEHIGHQYRAWRDYLTRCLDESMPPTETYALLHTASLVGLFTCVFVKAPIRSRIKHVHAAEVKRGLGGHHGNKGALLLRIVVDDSSVCFINCHLAAGQTQTMNRNHDIAEILEAEVLPAFPLAKDGAAHHSDVFASGGSGSMIMDHEICVLNGDLNYRIDTMGRDTVIKHITQNNLLRLLERDQLLLSRRKNAGNRLRAFQESEITFAPTYKYDVRSDRYDTSEKRRAPAWCDRILYRGIGKVKMEDYRRWEVRVSDHRPVSGRLRLRVKTVDPVRREHVWKRAQAEFERVRKGLTNAVQVDYLSNVLGLSAKEAAAALKT